MEIHGKNKSFLLFVLDSKQNPIFRPLKICLLPVREIILGSREFFENHVWVYNFVPILSKKTSTRAMKTDFGVSRRKFCLKKKLGKTNE